MTGGIEGAGHDNEFNRKAEKINDQIEAGTKEPEETEEFHYEYGNEDDYDPTGRGYNNHHLQKRYKINNKGDTIKIEYEQPDRSYSDKKD